ncbi:glycine--tRNA ligase subunit beta, partial [Parasphingorhabdus sp.]|uniref:glycine--tRNA ligase subunit beta n=1 Tax=Parasphingorhabdus sp. TaxID=2709688 RepID=UPI003C709BFF
LQGLMGGYYAEKEGLPVEVSHAIRDHYKPVGQVDDVPTDPVTVYVSLADKLDTLACFFAIDEKPTGSKDPFALRRAGLANLSLWQTNQLRGSHLGVLRKAIQIAALQLSSLNDRLINLGKASGNSGDPLAFAINREAEELWAFLVDRLKVQQREAGVRHDLIDAVFALGGEDDLVRLLARVKALQAFVETADGVNLLAGYKRASNILKKEGAGAPHLMRSEAGGADDGQGSASSAEHKPLSYTPEKAEKTLIEALDAAQPEVTAAIAAEQFETAMTALAALRGPIDQFFEDVTVNDEDETKRKARLALLARFRNAVHQVADFSKIEG